MPQITNVNYTDGNSRVICVGGMCMGLTGDVSMYKPLEILEASIVIRVWFLCMKQPKVVNIKLQ